MRNHLLLATLVALALSCTREPERTRRPRRPAAATATTTTTTTTAVNAATDAGATADDAAGDVVRISNTVFHEPPPLPPTVPQHWTGQAESLEASSRQAGAIVVARLEELGVPTLGAAEVSAFNATRWTVTRSLKGSLSGEVTLQLAVQTLPAERVEQVPRPGESYVLFVGGGSEGATLIRKVLPGTDENIAQVAPLAGR